MYTNILLLILFVLLTLTINEICFFSVYIFFFLFKIFIRTFYFFIKSVKIKINKEFAILKLVCNLYHWNRFWKKKKEKKLHKIKSDKKKIRIIQIQLKNFIIDNLFAVLRSNIHLEKNLSATTLTFIFSNILFVKTFWIKKKGIYLKLFELKNFFFQT